MNISNLKDLAVLASKGYKPADIKELLSLGEDSQSNTVEPVAPEEEAPADNVQKPVDNVQESDEPDYKSMYTELADQMNDLKAQLKQAQTANVKQNISSKDDEITDAERLISIAENLLI